MPTRVKNGTESRYGVAFYEHDDGRGRRIADPLSLAGGSRFVLNQASTLSLQAPSISGDGDLTIDARDGATVDFSCDYGKAAAGKLEFALTQSTMQPTSNRIRISGYNGGTAFDFDGDAIPNLGFRFVTQRSQNSGSFYFFYYDAGQAETLLQKLLKQGYVYIDGNNDYDWVHPRIDTKDFVAPEGLRLRIGPH